MSTVTASVRRPKGGRSRLGPPLNPPLQEQKWSHGCSCIDPPAIFIGTRQMATQTTPRGLSRYRLEVNLASLLF